ncbi:Rne/Rng family ribonuclease [Aeromicrobium terrae]|uniref:Ribonuclease E n=1 Tax=Aeromicrobium terrae TaxID=2498846 RepID=A0A5C8NKU2_9ACTN|nr:Rne/Rng family ribonuclease [Aeromicrobium terrae]
MLDDSSTESSESTSSTSGTRRRAAGRPAGPPAAVSSDIFAPPAKEPAKKKAPAKKAAASSDEASEDKPAKKAPAKKTATKSTAKKTAAKKTADAAPQSGLVFQAPETTTLPPRPKADRPDDDADGDDEGGDAPKRRKRSRGGRRRGNKSGEGADSDTSDDAADDSDDDASGEGGTRRRRRRARAGENASSSPDDPENTVVKVREGRSAEDEITGVSGSTRLEAKKQRRREGREAGRRRAPIVSEAEFLARRESVKREMVVRQRDQYTQIAVLEDGVLVEHYVARESQTSLIGNVYLGKVQNVLPSMEAAFVDIGAGRNAVLYAGEVDWSLVGNGKQRKIEDALSPGQAILVQVTKDPIGQKGARLTSQVSLPGRFLVYVPNGQTSGISRKLPENERARLKSLLKEVLPEDAGVIVRTAAEGATEEQLTRDVTALTARWQDIEKKVEAGKAPELLYAEPDLVIKVVRDLFNEDFASLVVQGDDAWDNISGYVQHVAPDLADRAKRWEPEKDDAGEVKEPDVFVAHRIEEQIHKALERKVFLPSGGSLVIDRTEAMTVVDVNTGKFTGSGGNLEETVTKNNLEAAEEIVRQLRLRDIGGIIVIDFIDMVLESNRDLVLRRLVECLGRDRTRHQVAEVTSLGLVQMTRKRIGTGLLESFSTDCEHCKGRGVVITSEPVEPKKEEPRRGRRGGGGGGGKGGGNKSNAKGGGSKKSEPKPKAEEKAGDKAEDTSGEKAQADPVLTDEAATS